MGKIYCIMGKSSTGKDTLFKKILGDESLALKTIVPYTTRPARAGEKNGVEYFFCDEKKVEELEREGRIIELRAYDTIHGIWKYFTVNDDQIDLEHQNYLIIGTLESYLKIRDYFGKEKVVPIYIEVEDHGKGIEDVKKAMEPLFTTKPEMDRSGIRRTPEPGIKQRAYAGKPEV